MDNLYETKECEIENTLMNRTKRTIFSFYLKTILKKNNYYNYNLII